MSGSRKKSVRSKRTRTPGVFKRGNRYRVTYRDGDGRQREESARTYEAARALRSQRVAEAAEGLDERPTQIHFRDYVLDWIETYPGRGRRGFRESTRDDYRRDIHRYLLPFFHEKHPRKLHQITPRDVARFVAWLCDEEAQGKRHSDEMIAKAAAVGNETPRDRVPQKRYLADATVSRILSPLKACLSTALQEGLLRSNPAAGVSLPARDEQRAIDEGKETRRRLPARVMTKDQLRTFMNVCPDKWCPLFEVLATTGIRISECLALRWSDLTLDGSQPQLHVRRAYVRKRFGPPKSQHSRREVPLDFALADRLRALRKSTDWHRDDDLVFPASNGKPMFPENLRRRVLKPTAQEAGISWIGFHEFRHTYASLLFAMGRNAVEVQHLLGHHSAAYTLATYVHLLPDQVGEALSLSVATGQADEIASQADFLAGMGT